MSSGRQDRQRVFDPPGGATRHITKHTRGFGVKNPSKQPLFPSFPLRSGGGAPPSSPAGCYHPTLSSESSLESSLRPQHRPRQPTKAFFFPSLPVTSCCQSSPDRSTGKEKLGGRTLFSGTHIPKSDRDSNFWETRALTHGLPHSQRHYTFTKQCLMGTTLSQQGQCFTTEVIAITASIAFVPTQLNFDIMHSMGTCINRVVWKLEEAALRI